METPKEDWLAFKNTRPVIIERGQQELVHMTENLEREIETEAVQIVDMDKFFLLAAK